MKKTGYIEITIMDHKGKLGPNNYNIRAIFEILQITENLFSQNSEKGRSTTIAYEIAEGSVKHVIRTTLQDVVGLNAVLTQIETGNYAIDFLELPAARALEDFQQYARENDYEYEIKTSISESATIKINKETKFVRSEDVWVDAELYFYGTIVDAGGAENAYIHLDTVDNGFLKIEASKALLTDFENNPLYKPYGVRVTGKQNIKSGEIDKSTLKLVAIIDYNPSFKEDYINSLIKKAKKSWGDVPDADEWLQNVRGYGA